MREQWKINLNYNSPESYTVDRGASEQSHKTLHRVYGIDSMELGTLYFLVTSWNINRLDAQPDISQRDKVHLSETRRLLTEKSKQVLLMSVTKIQRPKIIKFSMNQSGVQAIHIEGRGRIPVSVACFNCML